MALLEYPSQRRFLLNSIFYYYLRVVLYPEIKVTKSYEDYLKEIAELQKQAEEARRAELASAIAQIKSLMKQYNLTLKDLKLKDGKVPGSQGTTVAAKYRDPVSGETWTGRGRSPTWAAKAKAESKLDSLLITAEAKPAAKEASKPAPMKSVGKKPAAKAAPKPPKKPAAKPVTKKAAPKKVTPKNPTTKPAAQAAVTTTPTEAS